MRVRTLRGIGAMRRRTFDHLYVEIHRESLGWIASRVITRLVAECAMDGVLPGCDPRQRSHQHGDCEVPAVNAELLIWRKRETGQFPRRIGYPANHNIRRRIQSQSRRDEK